MLEQGERLNLKKVKNKNQEEITKEELKDTIEEISNEEILNTLEDYFWKREDLREILNLDFLQKQNIWIKKILDLCGFAREINSIYDLNILEVGKNTGIIYVKIKSNDFDEMNTILDFANKEITLNKLVVNKIKISQGIWSERLTMLINTAKEKWFKKILLLWWKLRDLDTKYKSKWYSFYPNRWFLATEKENRNPKWIKKIKKAKDWRIAECDSINELFNLEDETWEKIWLKYWKKIGDSINLEMDI